MVQVVAAGDLEFIDLETKFGLARTFDNSVFPEWQGGLPAITEVEQKALDRVRNQFLYIVKFGALEEIVKMVVLSPLLDLAGFYEPPFRLRTEQSVELLTEDDGRLVRGRIDVLVFNELLWALVIESKRSDYGVSAALPQGLFYMFCSPKSQQPAYGLVTTGMDFVFVKLLRDDQPRYALSRMYTLINPGNDLYDVLRVLKRLGHEIVQSPIDG
ncbi:hypothetical protein [Gloeobacter violaceus]|uniref:Gll0613 protein n=1 Tax=Gloeobacter violaceus (strain ATCC 29082 / PCC 7421) TaxID=251221 RepID=Q7NN02_GLOVI|nr:hypothetical protein [Gloeobacter violaceus]BAC88554.1 gll0613 [Gloeobacter violaceus PCC 7421]